MLDSLKNELMRAWPSGSLPQESPVREGCFRPPVLRAETLGRNSDSPSLLVCSVSLGASHTAELGAWGRLLADSSDTGCISHSRLNELKFVGVCHRSLRISLPFRVAFVLVRLLSCLKKANRSHIEREWLRLCRIWQLLKEWRGVRSSKMTCPVDGNGMEICFCLVMDVFHKQSGKNLVRL